MIRRHSLTLFALLAVTVHAAGEPPVRLTETNWHGVGCYRIEMPMGTVYFEKDKDGVHVEIANRVRQGNEHGVRDFAAIGCIQLLLPPGQQSQGLGARTALVGQIVGPAAICIDIAQMLVEMPREQSADDCEILIVAPREAAAILAGIGERNWGGRRVWPEACKFSGQVHPRVL